MKIQYLNPLTISSYKSSLYILLRLFKTNIKHFKGLNIMLIYYILITEQPFLVMH